MTRTAVPRPSASAEASVLDAALDTFPKLVLDNAKTREQQDACARALEFKCDVLWSLLDAVQLAYSKGS